MSGRFLQLYTSMYRACAIDGVSKLYAMQGLLGHEPMDEELTTARNDLIAWANGAHDAADALLRRVSTYMPLSPETVPLQLWTAVDDDYLLLHPGARLLHQSH